MLNLVPSAIQLGCVNSPVFRVENHIGKLVFWGDVSYSPVLTSLWIYLRYFRHTPIKPDETHICHAQQWPTPPSQFIDIAKPPTRALDLFNLYVALSCSSGRESIQLLQNFDDELFKKSHDPVLLAEDDRLDKMDRITKA